MNSRTALHKTHTALSFRSRDPSCDMMMVLSSGNVRLWAALSTADELEECFSRRESNLGRAERRGREEGEPRARRLVSQNSWPVKLNMANYIVS